VIVEPQLADQPADREEDRTVGAAYTQNAQSERGTRSVPPAA
jgi:hypothetical protein